MSTSTCIARLRATRSNFSSLSIRTVRAITTANGRTNSHVATELSSPRAPCRTYRPAPSNRRLSTQRQTLLQTWQGDPSWKKTRVFVALGSNMGDRVAMIEQACKEMESSGKIAIVRTSNLWETKAMYVLDQDNFVNGACEVQRTSSEYTSKQY